MGYNFAKLFFMSSSVKIAQTSHKVLDLIKERWSPRSYSGTPVTEEEVLTILEGASWAPSANNSQPWRYVYAIAGTPGFDKLFSALMPGNQPWAKNAGALILSVGIKELPDLEQKNHYYAHDTGMSNAFLLLQADSMGINGHVMAGFHKQQIAESLELLATEEPLVIISLGRRDDAEKLEEPYKSRELAPRTRKPLSEFTKLV